MHVELRAGRLAMLSSMCGASVSIIDVQESVGVKFSGPCDLHVGSRGWVPGVVLGKLLSGCDVRGPVMRGSEESAARVCIVMAPFHSTSGRRVFRWRGADPVADTYHESRALSCEVCGLLFT